MHGVQPLSWFTGLYGQLVSVQVHIFMVGLPLDATSVAKGWYPVGA